MTDVLKPIAIIGAGGIVKDAHLPAYKNAGFTVECIYDIEGGRAEALAREFGIERAFEDIDDFIEHSRDPDCIYDIAIPANSILSVLQKIPKNSSVLIQKPMGETLAEANKILALCKANKLTAGLNFQLRHAPYIVEAKRMIDSGSIGDLHDIDVRLNVNTPWHLWDFLFDKPRVEILYHSIHYLDMIRFFLGEPEKIFAKTTIDPRMKDMAATRTSIILDYGESVRANINTNHGHRYGIRHQESYFKFEGTEGAIKITVGLYLDYPRGMPDKFEFITSDDPDWRELKLTGSWFPDAFIGPMAGLMAKTEDPGYDYINSVDDAIKTMELVEKCYESNA